MKRALMEILACPHCGEDLILEGETTEKDEIMAGTLTCPQCTVSFAVRDGVPCMLDHAGRVNRIQQGFTEQWQFRQLGQFEIDTSYGQDPYERASFLSEVNIIPSLKPNDWVLDAGCGSGEVTYAVAAQNPQVQIVGLDFCDTIYVTAKQAKSYPNSSFVHGDLMRPPFKKSSFTGLYCWGVLHHTQDTRAAFQTMAPLITKDGTMAIWIYPHPSESPLSVKFLYMVRDVFFLGRGHLIPAKLRLRMAQAVSLLYAPTFIVASGLDALSMRKKFGKEVLNEMMTSYKIANWKENGFFRFLSFLLFDTITPENQFRHKQADVLQWFEDNGFVEVQTHRVIPGHYWGKRAL